jgi:hypothetical protein
VNCFVTRVKCFVTEERVHEGFVPLHPGLKRVARSFLPGLEIVGSEGCGN